MFLGSTRRQLPKDGTTWRSSSCREARPAEILAGQKQRCRRCLPRWVITLPGSPRGSTHTASEMPGSKWKSSQAKRFRHTRVCIPRSKIAMHVEPVMCTTALQIPQLLLASPTADLVLKGPEIEESLRCREQQGPQENDGHPSPLPNQEDRYSGQCAPAAGDCP